MSALDASFHRLRIVSRATAKLMQSAKPANMPLPISAVIAIQNTKDHIPKIENISESVVTFRPTPYLFALVALTQN
jgi:hypothetical protein